MSDNDVGGGGWVGGKDRADTEKEKKKHVNSSAPCLIEAILISIHNVF